jgi:PilZ domain
MRARRYPLTLPIRCRRTGEEGWLEGVTINISSSGVLFRTSESLDVDTQVEMTIVLGESPARGSELRCDGHIVRIESGNAATPSMAAVFSRYNLQRATEVGV